MNKIISITLNYNGQFRESKHRNHSKINITFTTVSPAMSIVTAWQADGPYLLSGNPTKNLAASSSITNIDMNKLLFISPHKDQRHKKSPVESKMK